MSIVKWRGEFVVVGSIVGNVVDNDGIGGGGGHSTIDLGAGEIAQVAPNTSGWECWKVADPEEPSSQPSESPSEEPSLSAQPSSDPSEQPSSDPSESPSEQPSSEPSSTPSCSPSFSPTQYPDWTGSSTATCLNDDKMPTYMLNDQGWYLSTTLEKCCERHFFWGLKECLGTSDVGSNDWYVKYEDETCVQDCNGASPCGGVADSWVELYKSKEMCCEDRLPWKPRCRFY